MIILLLTILGGTTFASLVNISTQEAIKTVEYFFETKEVNQNFVPCLEIYLSLTTTDVNLALLVRNFT